MAVSSFRLAFWSLVVCLGLVTLLALAGTSAAPAEEVVEEDDRFEPMPGLLLPDRRTRARVAALERDAERLEQRLHDVRLQIERHDRLHAADATRLSESEAVRQRAVVTLSKRIDTGALRVSSLEQRMASERAELVALLEAQRAELAALQAELAEVASREVVVPPAEPAMLFVPFPQPVVLHAERTEPVRDPEPLRVSVEVEAVEVPRSPPPRHVQRPHCDPCEPIGFRLAWPGLP